ncbi:hypothetical protein [Spirosoma arcticum]
MEPQPRKKPLKREEEAPLDALRLVLNQQAVLLNPIDNQVSALPVDKELEYYFVPMQYMQQYQAYYRPGKPFKNLKLINFDKPAISLSFFFKHKYSIERNAMQVDVVLHLKNYRDELLNKSLMQQLSPTQQQQLQQADQLLRAVRQDPAAYQACFSNYYHYYRYWYCTYRFFDDQEKTKATTSSEHLLKHTERIPGQVHERLNIIFIDPHYINRPVPHDHKLIDRELDTFPIHIRQGITTLYLRKV